MYAAKDNNIYIVVIGYFMEKVTQICLIMIGYENY